MEEPENGIHPLRIPEMLRLARQLSDADADETEELGARVALRQVLINTHSPLIVQELPDDELLMAQSFRLRGATFIDFKPLDGTWRSQDLPSSTGGVISRGELVRYLTGGRVGGVVPGSKRRVADHYGIAEQLDMFRSRLDP